MLLLKPCVPVMFLRHTDVSHVNSDQRRGAGGVGRDVWEKKKKDLKKISPPQKSFF